MVAAADPRAAAPPAIAGVMDFRKRERAKIKDYFVMKMKRSITLTRLRAVSAILYCLLVLFSKGFSVLLMKL